MQTLKTCASTLAAALLWSSAAVAAGHCTPDAARTFSKAEAERTIRAGEEGWAASVISRDPAVLKRILSEDLVWVFDGRILGKAEAITGAENGATDFVSNQLDYAHIRFFGTTALVQGREHWVRRNPDREGHFVWTDTWVLCGGTWQIVAAQDTTLVDGGK